MRPGGKALGEARAYLAGLGSDLLELCQEIDLDGVTLNVDTYDEPSVTFKGFVGDNVALSFTVYNGDDERSANNE